MITALILTKNNESSISTTLNSVTFCEEICIIDDFSTDNTRGIAEKFGATVVQRNLNNDFSAQRNYGLKKAKGDWILFIDSDEVVPESLKNEILEVISRQGRGKEGIDGYFIKRDDIFLGKKLLHGETKNVELLRLARKGKGIWKRPVHEYWDVKGNTRILNHPLLHYPHPNVAQFIDDINRYTTINAEYLYTQGVRSNVCTIIGYPIVKFIQNYFFRLGYLDGTAGCIMAILMSFHSFLTRAKLYIRQNATE